LVGLVIDEQSEGHGMTPIDLFTKPGQPNSSLLTAEESRGWETLVSFPRKERASSALLRMPTRWAGKNGYGLNHAKEIAQPSSTVALK
jgi:hypothetical protein